MDEIERLHFEIADIRTSMDRMKDAIAKQADLPNHPPVPPKPELTIPAFSVRRKGDNHKARVTVTAGFTIDRTGSTAIASAELTLSAAAVIYARYRKGTGWETSSGSVIQQAATLPAFDDWYVLFPIAEVGWSSVTSGVSTITQHHVGALIYIEDPRGLVEEWQGAYNAVPAGYALCDGGTVDGFTTTDMRELFIYGANGTTVGVGATGGAKTHTHTDLKFSSLDVQLDHTHAVPGDAFNNGAAGSDKCFAYATSASWTPAGWPAAHDIAVSQTAGKDHMPPWLALAYIVKL